MRFGLASADVENDLLERIETSMTQLTAAWDAFLTGLFAFLPHLLQAALILLIGWVVIRLVPRPVSAMLLRAHIDPVAVKYVLRVIKVFLWVIVAVMALDKLGVPVTSLLTLLAAVGAAVALAIKDNLANLASGVMLLFTKPFKSGDYIEVDSLSGTIREIELMHTYLDTVGNMRVAVPNTKMMTDAIVNYSAHDTRRQDLTYAISYDNDLLNAKEILLSVVNAHPLTLQEPVPPRVVVNEFADSSIQLTVQVWCANAEYWNLRFDLNEKVKKAFDEGGVVIPYNQLDVHLCSDERGAPADRLPSETDSRRDAAV